MAITACIRKSFGSPETTLPVDQFPFKENANTLLFGIPGRMFAYPEPQYTVEPVIDGPSITEPPLWKLNRIAPGRGVHPIHKT
jgi:hypothetical protein